MKCPFCGSDDTQVKDCVLQRTARQSADVGPVRRVVRVSRLSSGCNFANLLFLKQAVAENRSIGTSCRGL